MPSQYFGKYCKLKGEEDNPEGPHWENKPMFERHIAISTVLMGSFERKTKSIRIWILLAQRHLMKSTLLFCLSIGMDHYDSVDWIEDISPSECMKDFNHGIRYCVMKMFCSQIAFVLLGVLYVEATEYTGTTVRLFIIYLVFMYLFVFTITKTCLFKYNENFTTKKWKFSDKKFWYFSYLYPKHRLWVLVRNASRRRF